MSNRTRSAATLLQRPDESEPTPVVPQSDQRDLLAMPEVYIPCMASRNHADCVGNDAVLSGHSHSLLAQLDLTPKSKRGLAASDPGEAADSLNGV